MTANRFLYFIFLSLSFPPPLSLSLFLSNLIASNSKCLEKISRYGIVKKRRKGKGRRKEKGTSSFYRWSEDYVKRAVKRAIKYKKINYDVLHDRRAIDYRN